MANKMQIKRGNKANLPTLSDGEFGFCKDTNELFIGNGGINHPVALTGGADFVKFDNGIMIEWGDRTFNAVVATTPWGGLYTSDDLKFDNYPEPFVSVPKVFVNANRTASGLLFLCNAEPVTQTNPGAYRVVSAVVCGGAQELIVDYLAVGRWRA